MSRAAVLLLALLGACASRTEPARAPAEQPASEFRLRNYYVVVLRRGPAWTAEKTPEVQELFAGHMAHLERMAAEGKLVLAGPFDAPKDGGVGTPAGLCIYAVETREEAERLASEDPAVQAGRFTVEALPWYGPDGISYAGSEKFARRDPPQGGPRGKRSRDRSALARLRRPAEFE
ncbi:MAG TPA: YciI family protein [Nannocystis sp.]